MSALAAEDATDDCLASGSWEAELDCLVREKEDVCRLRVRSGFGLEFALGLGSSLGLGKALWLDN